MKILVISAEVWRNDKNGGNVLSNIFDGLPYEFAQIYCSPGTPSNRLCKKYYQITDTMLIHRLFKGPKPGNSIEFKDTEGGGEDENNCEQENPGFYNFFRRHRLEIFNVLRSLLWIAVDWRTKQLEEFILSFNPDIIFAPCYASHTMLHLDRYAAQLTKRPVISYISDDNYSLKQVRFSPVYWLDRFALRENMRRTFPYYQLMYTMTEEQKRELKTVFHGKIKILKKYGEFCADKVRSTVGQPIRLIYAGGIYCGRWKTLKKIVEAMREINQQEIKMQLHIFTGNQLTESQKKVLHNERDSFVHASVGKEELEWQYAISDIALHVESFDLRNRYLTRLSFSTKIIDCLSSGCAVMAVCWKQQAGFKYLLREDAAICISKPSDIPKQLRRIVKFPDIIREYSEKACQCGLKYHKKQDVQKMIKSDFEFFLRTGEQGGRL